MFWKRVVCREKSVLTLRPDFTEFFNYRVLNAYFLELIYQITYLIKNMAITVKKHQLWRSFSA